MEKETKQLLKNSADKEKCVVCGALTDYSTETPIGGRAYYIEGAGQLCQKCYYEIYLKKQEKAE